MSPYEKLLEEFERYARSTHGVKPLMQHISQRLHEAMARYNWVGFYFMESPAFNALVLGPYVGSFSPPSDHARPRLCGAAATSGKTVTINNVAADPRYLGSDLVKSNIVVPIFASNGAAKKRVMAELCIESYSRTPSCSRAEVHRVLRRPSRPVHGKRAAAITTEREATAQCRQILGVG